LTIIRLNNVSASWDTFTISDVDLEILKDEYFVILGPTGAGKTLLLELLAGFWRADTGRIELFELDATTTPPEERGMGFVYQNYMLFPHLNVFENIAFGLKLKKLSKDDIKKEVGSIAKDIGITELLDRNISTLSGGESQRVALARALVMKPNILLLDEPLSALDPNIQEKVRDEIKEIHKKYGMTTVHITHNREEAIIMADRIAIMKEGKIHQVGHPQDIFRKPKTRFVAEFVGVQNIFKGKIGRAGRVEISGLVGANGNKGLIFTTSDLKGIVHVALRPEDIIITTKKVQTSARNVLSGKIDSMKDLGTVIRLEVNAGRTFFVNITNQALDELGIKLGSNVYLMFKASAVHVFN
jgi:molybdate/tungstate transport system ATP-binding protein